MEKFFLMTLFGCNKELLDLTINLLKKFKQKYGHSKFIRVIREIEVRIDADNVPQSFLLEVAEIINKNFLSDSYQFDLNRMS